MSKVEQMIAISIHTPLAGSDMDFLEQDKCDIQFQSTLPLRGVTKERWYNRYSDWDFNPHSPCGE